jgi:hypothetical protein
MIVEMLLNAVVYTPEMTVDKAATATTTMPAKIAY